MLVRLRRDSGDRIAGISDVNAKRQDLKPSDDVAIKSIARSIAACMYVLGVELHGPWPCWCGTLTASQIAKIAATALMR